MKKRVIWLFLVLIFLFSGCSQRPYGNPSELMQYDWHASLDGGGEIDLHFNGEHASLVMQNGDEQEEIAGRVIADDSSFVIFDRELAQNYGFQYVPKGEKLELSFEGNTIELTAERK